MWFQRSVSVMHGTSLAGVSFTWLSHDDDGAAVAPLGTRSAATAQHSAASHLSCRRSPLLTGIRASLSFVPCADSVGMPIPLLVSAWPTLVNSVESAIQFGHLSTLVDR